jgi:hypothetical protein
MVSHLYCVRCQPASLVVSPRPVWDACLQALVADPQEEGLQEVVQKVFGFPNFRGHQLPVVQAVLQGRSTLAIMPTGRARRKPPPPAAIIGAPPVVAEGSWPRENWPHGSVPLGISITCKPGVSLHHAVQTLSHAISM